MLDFVQLLFIAENVLWSLRAPEPHTVTVPHRVDRKFIYFEALNEIAGGQYGNRYRHTIWRQAIL